MDTNERLKKASRIAKRKNKEAEDTYQAKLIKSEKGIVLSENEEILQRWREYFHEFMNEESPRCRRDRVQAVVDVSKVEDIRSEEVTKALKKMKNGKAVGRDNIPVEVWKHTGDSGVTYLTELLEKVLEEETIPGEWRKSSGAHL